MANLVYASYNGSQEGFTIRETGNLNQLVATGVPANINDIAAGDDDNVFLASANHLYNYKTDGTLITNMTFPDTGIIYTSVSYYNGTIVAAYKGSQQGFTVRDTNLNQLSWVSLGFDINGIALGKNDDVFLASGNHLYHYKLDGTLITNMTFPTTSINYTSVSVYCDRVYASYNGSQEGFTVRDMQLNQLTFVNTGFNINGIAAGVNDDVFLASGNNLYHYSTNGNLITQMTFPIASINYTGITGVFTVLT